MKISINLTRNPLAKVACVFLILLTVWWISIFYRNLETGIENNAFTLIYPWLSLFGGILGLFIAKKWGGFKSYLGSSLSFFSLGLLAQFFGQVCYAYNIYIRLIEVPYPSVGDIGYFGSVILYIIATYYLGQSAGAKFNLKNYKGRALAILIPALMLILSFSIFLKDYVPDSGQWMKTFLDFGYPLGQAIYVSFALLAFLLSRQMLGGIMRKPILFLIFALIIQYISDFTFLYQVNRNSWYVGGVNDYMYLVSYFFMTLSLIYIGNAFKIIQAKS